MASGLAAALSAARDVERLVQLQGDTVAARDLAGNIRLRLNEWRGIASLSMPELRSLLDVEVRCVCGRMQARSTCVGSQCSALVPE
jgi:hypothetical protein